MTQPELQKIARYLMLVAILACVAFFGLSVYRGELLDGTAARAGYVSLGVITLLGWLIIARAHAGFPGMGYTFGGVLMMVASAIASWLKIGDKVPDLLLWIALAMLLVGPIKYQRNIKRQ